MIEILNCTKIFKKHHIEKKALNNINLKINNTGFVFIVGKSGSGKSTLLNLIANFDSATSGSIKYDDVDLNSLTEKERDEYLFNEVGFVFQAYNLFEELSVKENIALGLKNNSQSLEDEIIKLLKEVDLEGYQNKKVKNLSGGEKQRVSLARALIKNPKILLCDEPCGNLDNINSRKVLDILKTRSKDSLVLIVSHSLNDAYLYADRIITLQEGEIIGDKYINEGEKHEGIYVIKDLNNITNQEYDEIKEGILSKKIVSIRSRKELFKNFDQNIESNKKETKTKKSNFLKSFSLIIKLINSKIFKVGAFGLITSFALGIFSSILTLEKFNPDEFNKNAVLNNDGNYISYNKLHFDSETYDSRFLGKVTDEDKDFLAKKYDGEYFERKLFSIHTLATNYQFSNSINTSLTTFNSFYSVELQGLNVVDETFLKELLDIDDVIILNESEYTNGVYITDYFADSLMMHNGFKDYDDLIEKYHKKSINEQHNYAKIKGIIKTNYKEKLKTLLGQIKEGKKVDELLKQEENYKYYDYLRLALNSAYTYDKNFAENADVDNIYIHRIETPFGPIKYPNLKPIKIDKENTILLSYSMVSSAFPLLSRDEIQKILDTTQFEISFLTNQNNENEIPRFTKKVNIGLKESYNNEIYGQKVNGQYPVLSEDLYQELKKEAFYTIGFLFNDEKIHDLNSLLKDRHIELNNIYYKYSNIISEQVVKFNDVFKVLDIFCMILCVFIVIYYAFSVIKDNKYNIGVLKSLGYRGNELSVFFLSSFILYFIFAGGLFGIIFNWLTKLINNVLMFSLSEGLAITKITTVPIVSFNLNIYLIVLLSLLISTLLFSLIYLFILRKYKIIRVIQNKE